MSLASRFKSLLGIAKGAASNSAKGTTKLVLGAALVGGAIFLSGGMLATPIGALSGVPLLGGTSYGTVAAIGLGLALSGASTLLTKPAGQQTQASNGLGVNSGNIGNSGQQGNAIPLIYGECLVGTTPIEVWSDVEDIDVYADSAGSIETAFGERD